MAQSLLSKQAFELVQADRAWLPALSNVVALLWEMLDDVSWVGFICCRTSRLNPYRRIQNLS